MKAQITSTAAPTPRRFRRAAFELIGLIAAGLIGFGLGQALGRTPALPAADRPLLVAPAARDQYYAEAGSPAIVQPAVRDQWYAAVTPPTIDERARATGRYYTSQYTLAAPTIDERARATGRYYTSQYALAAPTIDERARATGRYYTSQYVATAELFVVPGARDDWRLRR